MKKTKKTIMTAALLSAAVTVQSQLAAPSAGNESEAAALYGPPWVFHDKGDLNMDNKINIVDLILLKSNGTGDNETRYWRELGDFDADETISKTDIKIMQRSLFGLPANDDSWPPDDIVPQPEYGIPEVSPEPSYQTKYGAPPVFIDDDEPAVTEPETDPSFWDTGMQPKYGIPPIDPGFVPVNKPVTTSEAKVTQPVYGPPFAEPSEEPAYTEEKPAVTTTESEEPEFEPEPVQLVYGPPSYFMDEDK